jgi:ribosomal protein S18 acetylase RimI-like enzyme
MEHVLDNPAWNALISGNKHLSYGNNCVKYFDKEVSPFVAFNENTPGNFQLLHEILPHNGPALFVATKEIEIPAQWKVLNVIKGFQMVCDVTVAPYQQRVELVELTDEHIPQMLALTKLTNPGPFAQRTIDFGHYYGVFDGEKLVAMTGQRMHPFEYAEVSAVCTHPDYLGKGYARALLLYHLHRLQAVLNIPFLHVRNDNERAIKVYEGLGFSVRSEVYFYVILKAG